MEPGKPERLKEMQNRLDDQPAAQSEDEAFEALQRVMVEVEDEYTSIPNNPDSWLTDGRLYPPQADAGRAHCPGVKRYRSRKHNTYIAENGALEIRDAAGNTVYSKAGADGRHVRDFEQRRTVKGS